MVFGIEMRAALKKHEKSGGYGGFEAFKTKTERFDTLRSFHFFGLEILFQIVHAIRLFPREALVTKVPIRRRLFENGVSKRQGFDDGIALVGSG